MALCRPFRVVYQPLAFFCTPLSSMQSFAWCPWLCAYRYCVSSSWQLQIFHDTLHLCWLLCLPAYFPWFLRVILYFSLEWIKLENGVGRCWFSHIYRHTAFLTSILFDDCKVNCSSSSDSSCKPLLLSCHPAAALSWKPTAEVVTLRTFRMSLYSLCETPILYHNVWINGSFWCLCYSMNYY